MDIATFQANIEMLSFEAFKILLKLKSAKLTRIRLTVARHAEKRQRKIISEDWNAEIEAETMQYQQYRVI
jgi:hypothetical protein